MRRSTLSPARTGATVLIAGVAALGILFAVLRTFAVFGTYDDEGYMLLCLKHYVTDGHLYTKTFSQYGPAYYFVQSFFFQLLRIPISHDTGRIVTLLYWAGSALAGGLFIKKITRSISFGCAAALGCLIAGAVLANEPGHPQQLILLLLMIAVTLSVSDNDEPSRLRLFLLGAVAALLIFTKVNVGLFYCVALSHALLCILTPGKLRSLGLTLCLVYALGGPWFLMHAHFADWARNYCLIAIVCGSATFAIGALLRVNAPKSPRILLPAAGGLLAAALLIVAATAIQGMSLATLIRGVVLDPMRHRSGFFAPFELSTANMASAFAICAAIAGLWFMRSRIRHGGVLVDLIRCVVGFGIAVLLIGGTHQSIGYHRIGWYLCFLPLSLIPGARNTLSAAELFPRLLIANLAATEFLQAYPVGGSQIGMASIPLVLWSLLCGADGLSGIASAWQSYAEAFRIRTFAPALILLLAITEAGLIAVRTMRELPPRSHLRGSTFLHLPSNQERDYQFLSKTLAANCTTLFTMPGMGSLNFWSGVPTPNGWNLTAWMKEFEPEKQSEILTLLKSEPNSCVVYNSSLLSTWKTTQQEVAALPLAHHIIFDMPKIAERGDYEIRIEPDRKAPWKTPDSSASSPK